MVNVMGTRFLGIGREKARSRDRQKAFRAKAEKAYNNLQSQLGQLRGQVSDANKRANLSASDLFGDSITRATDAIRSNANNTKMTLGRAAAARGGDVTGARGVKFDGLDVVANKSEGNVIRQYDDKAEAANARSRSRADQLMNMLLSGNFRDLEFQRGNEKNERMLDLQRRQANQKLVMDIISTGGEVAASAVAPAAAGAAGAGGAGAV